MELLEILKKKLKLNIAEPLTEIDDWVGWYKGYLGSFHKYNVYDGDKIKKIKRASMCMPKKICEDWANLLLNEKVEITSENRGFARILEEVFDSNSFYVKGNQLIEIAFALGTGAFVEYIEDKAIKIDYIRADMIFPLSWDNTGIKECVFASEKFIDGKKYYYINIHRLNDLGEYVIENKLFTKEKGAEETLDGVAATYETNSHIKRFQIVKPNLINNINFDSPFGISVFANAIDRIKKVDLIFDSGNTEFALGRKRIIVPISMAQVNASKVLNAPIFDTNDLVFTAFKTADESKVDKPIDLTTELRVEAHSKGLQDALNYLADGCGLGTDRYSYDKGGGVKTATEVISEKSDLYQNIKKHEIILRQVLTDMCKAIADIFGLGDIDVSINFDDSIIEDNNAIRQQALIEFNAGLIDEVEYFTKVYGISEEEAIKKVKDIKARQGEEEIEENYDETIGDGDE